MKLEQLMYQPKKALETPQRYRISDLESLSATVLYDSGKLEGNSWGKSFKTDLYFKKTSLGDLHVHCTKDGLITGANLDGKPISNYEASILDLLKGLSRYKEGFGKW